MSIAAVPAEDTSALPAENAGLPHARGFRERWPVLLLMLLAFGSVLALMSSTPGVLYSPHADDVWFGADIDRVCGMYNPHRAIYYEVRRHPVFSLTVIPPALTIQAVTGLDLRHTIVLFSALLAAAIIGMLWAILRRTGRSRPDSFLLCLLLMCSSTWMFWFSIPETFPLGAFTILAALLAACIRWRDTWRDRVVLVTAGAFTFFATITNGMFGLLLLWFRLSKRRFALYSAAVLLGVAGFHFSEYLFFSGKGENTVFPVGAKFLLPEAAGGPLRATKVLFLDSFVAPKLDLIRQAPEWTLLSAQYATLGSGSPWGVVALAGWFALFILGAAAMWNARSRHPVFCNLLLAGLAGQWALYMLYGDQTFLYVFHVLPLLVLVAAFAFERRQGRSWIRAGAVVLAVAAGTNNFLVLREAKIFAATLGTPSATALEQKERRPRDDWPRGIGHLVIGKPGAAPDQKAFMEPGGGFSPEPGSFGVSFWVVDASGRRIAAGDSLPLTQTNQTVGFDDAGRPYADFSTPYYRGRWTMTGAGRWELHLSSGNESQPKQQLWMVLRGVGPAAGPLNQIERQPDGTLLLNRRWRMRVSGTDPVVGADESKAGLDGPTNTLPITSPGGWAYARVALSLPTTIMIEDSKSSFASTISTLAPVYPGLRLPDPRFADCLRAQITQIAIAVQGRQIAPFDPFLLPYPWARPSAYAVAALARSGNPVLAKPLALELASHDFYGPFASEADGPGLSLWAIGEVAARLGDPAFDESLWPDVKRKAELILKFSAAAKICREYPEYDYRSLLEKDFYWQHEMDMTCLPAEHGLIFGRLEHLTAPLYTTAVSYRGLLDAAVIAQRLGKSEEAGRWRSEAERLRQSWAARLTIGKSGLAERARSAAWVAFEVWHENGLYPARDAALLALKRESTTEAVSGSALWPTWIGTGSPPEVLKKRMGFFGSKVGVVKDAAGPQRALARAHQALLSGDQKLPWDTLKYCWSSQIVPGAYTFGDSFAKKMTLDHPWEYYRAMFDGDMANPSIWDAAEMLALQIDMLAFLDESSDEPVIVIGAGIPPEWLAQPMEVTGLSMKGARIDWSWDGKRLHVMVKGRHWRVRPGGAFATRDSEIIYADRQD